jgi:hypothetical protein
VDDRAGGSGAAAANKSESRPGMDAITLLKVHEKEHEKFKEARDLTDESEIERMGAQLAQAKEHLLSDAAV